MAPRVPHSHEQAKRAYNPKADVEKEVDGDDKSSEDGEDEGSESMDDE